MTCKKKACKGMAKFCNILMYVYEVYVKVKEVEYKEVNIKN